MTTFPYGYGSARLTWAQLEQQRTVARLHPEVRKRARALFEHLASLGVPLGVGTGWRVQPSGRPGFASPGNSYHESFPSGSSNANALAIDTVPATSWDAMELHLDRFGLRSFRHVNHEPWHIQPVEVPTSRRWATSCPPLNTWHGAGGVAGPPTPATPSVPSATLRQGDEGLRVIHLQNICRFWRWCSWGWDGRYGPQTVIAVRTMQTALGAGVDGVYGQRTRASLVAFLAAMARLAA